MKDAKGHGRDAVITVHVCEHTSEPLYAFGLCSKCYHRSHSNTYYHVNKHKKPKDYYTRVALLSKFGLTLEQYEDMLTAQGGVCKICRQPERTKRRLAVDHNHTTGKVRGLLCAQCNTRLGHLESEFYVKALAYLKEYE